MALGLLGEGWAYGAVPCPGLCQHPGAVLAPWGCPGTPGLFWHSGTILKRRCYLSILGLSLHSAPSLAGNSFG